MDGALISRCLNTVSTRHPAAGLDLPYCGVVRLPIKYVSGKAGCGKCKTDNTDGGVFFFDARIFLVSERVEVGPGASVSTLQQRVFN